jgi:hypothetical protein
VLETAAAEKESENEKEKSDVIQRERCREQNLKL